MNYIASDTDLTAIANAIRTKGGTSAELEFPNGFVSAVEAIPSGGGGYDGLELLSVDSTTGNPTAWKWHGASIPNNALRYMMYNSGVAPTIDLSEVEDVGNDCFSNSYLRPQSVQNIKTCGTSAFQVAVSSGAFDLSATSITFAELTGKNASGAIPGSVFRSQYAQYYQKIFLPKFQYVGNYVFYQRRVANSEVEIGSIGYPVIQVNSMPFGGSAGVGTVTVYVTGSELDSIKTAIQNSASASYTFVYKAAENTTYGGTSYSAGDTILTVGGA